MPRRRGPFFARYSCASYACALLALALPQVPGGEAAAATGKTLRPLAGAQMYTIDAGIHAGTEEGGGGRGPIRSEQSRACPSFAQPAPAAMPPGLGL